MHAEIAETKKGYNLKMFNQINFKRSIAFKNLILRTIQESDERMYLPASLKNSSPIIWCFSDDYNLLHPFSALLRSLVATGIIIITHLL